MVRIRKHSAAVFIFAVSLTAQGAAPVPASHPPAASVSDRQGPWVGSWAASQQIPEPTNAVPLESFRNATLRQIVHLSAGGPAIRVRISNAFGAAPLHV